MDTRARVTGAEIKEQGQTQSSCIESSARYKGAGSAKGRQTRLGPGLLHISLAPCPSCPHSLWPFSNPSPPALARVGGMGLNTEICSQKSTLLLAPWGPSWGTRPSSQADNSCATRRLHCIAFPGWLRLSTPPHPHSLQLTFWPGGWRGVFMLRELEIHTQAGGDPCWLFWDLFGSLKPPLSSWTPNLPLKTKL